MHIHLNPVGGIAGDMFVAAVLDLFPEFEEVMLQTLSRLPSLNNVKIGLERHSDSVLTGSRFSVDAPVANHHCAQYTDLDKNIVNSGLSSGAVETARAILEILAAAEGAVHGVSLEQVTLHEAGSPDSLTDILCAGFLIDSLGDVSWSCDALPAGRGRVLTEHGEMPLPVPAVAHLLEGYPVIDDGRTGERITPTGAAILRYLNPDFGTRLSPMVLSAIGTGFGTSKFSGISNVLRLIAYSHPESAARTEQVAILEFEVDDQSPEDLGVGLNRLRETDGVLDVTQTMAIGKKGRVTVHVQVLGKPEYLNNIAMACTAETSTLGVRYQLVDRYILDREIIQHDSGTSVVPMKITKRPGAVSTAKAEFDHIASAGDFSQRKKLKQISELEAEKLVSGGGPSESQ